MPSEANGKVLMSIMNPEIFLTFVLNAREQFSEDELEMLAYIQQRFKKESPTQISETSHQEEAWKQFVNSDHLINYDMAFSLKAI